jgi:hypothetical protein
MTINETKRYKELIKTLYIMCGELSQQLRVQVTLNNLHMAATGITNSQTPFTDDLVNKTDKFLMSIKDEVDLFNEL